MKRITEQEYTALTGILKLECLGLTVSRVMKPLIDDKDFKKLFEAGILEQEGRINAIKKFIADNITNKGV